MRTRPRTARSVRALAALGLAGATLLAGCRDDDVEPPVPPRFAASLGVDLAEMERSDSYLYMRVLSEGSGEPAEDGERIQVTYTGWLPDGTQFDSNEGAAPLVVTLGKDFLIDGFMEGVEGMRPGEERQLAVPPDLAYGPAGDPGVIPRDSWLVFRVRRVDAPTP